MGWALCYNMRMSTTQNNPAETSRPCCCVCGADHVDDNVRATEHGAMCVMCVEDVRADMCADAHERSMGCDDGWDHWDRVRECDADAFADSIDRD